MTPITHEQITINGIRMSYARAGSGERLIVLLHGFPESWYSWRHQIPALAEHATVVAPDMRGYGATEKPRWGYELDVLVSDIVTLIRELGYDRATVVGHDWGGVIAWALAIAYPQRVERLAVLNCPHPAVFRQALRHNPRQLLRSWYMLAFQIPWLPELILSAGGYALIAHLLRSTLVDRSAISPAELAEHVRAIAQPGALTCAINYYRGLVQQGDRGMFRGSGMRVAAPTLLIWGEADRFLGTELTYDTARYVPDLRIHYIPNCSHWVQQERPAEVNAALERFVLRR